MRDPRGVLQVIVDPMHPGGEVRQGAAQRRALEITEDLVAECDRIGIAKAREEDRPGSWSRNPTRERHCDLVEVQVEGERRRGPGGAAVSVVAWPEEDGRDRGETPRLGLVVSS